MDSFKYFKDVHYKKNALLRLKCQMSVVAFLVVICEVLCSFSLDVHFLRSEFVEYFRVASTFSQTRREFDVIGPHTCSNFEISIEMSF